MQTEVMVVVEVSIVVVVDSSVVTVVSFLKVVVVVVRPLMFKVKMERPPKSATLRAGLKEK